MSKLTLAGLTLPLLLLFVSPDAVSRAPATKLSSDAQSQSGTLQKMIVQTGSVTMRLDLSRLNGMRAPLQTPATMQFTIAPDSFFTILVYNDLLRGPENGSMALSAAGANTGYNLPGIKRVIETTDDPKTSVKSGLRPCSARCKNRLHVVQYRRKPIQLRLSCTITERYRRAPARLRGIGEGAWPSFRFPHSCG